MSTPPSVSSCLLFPLTEVTIHDIGVGGVAYSPNSELLASAGLDGTVKLWTARELGEQKTLQGHTERVSSVAFFSQGKTMNFNGP